MLCYKFNNKLILTKYIVVGDLLYFLVKDIFSLGFYFLDIKK